MALLNDIINVRIASRARGQRRRNRYYMFRNTERLKKLKRYNILFGFLSFLSYLAIAAAFIGLTFWILATIFTLGLAAKNMDEFLTVCLVTGGVGLAIIFASMIVRFLIERVYIIAEKQELKAEPEGAEKYLKVMKTNNKVFLINIIFLVSLIVIFGILALIGFDNNSVVTAAIIIAIVASVATAIAKRAAYNKIAPEIKEIRAERKENKKLMID